MNEPRRIRHVDEKVRINDLLDRSQVVGVIEDRIFERCEVVGPGVLVVLDDVEMHRNKIPVDSFWTVAPHRLYEGGIGLRRTTFIECQFVNVGIATTPEIVERFLAFDVPDHL